jgi:tRNA(adenine34) deaminase
VTNPIHIKFLEQALNEAHKARLKGEVPVGAVVVFEGKIIARGHNLRETNQSVLGHAELAALTKASKKIGSWRLNECDIYVTLEPCPMCAGAMQQARVRHVYYGASDPKAGVVSLDLNIHANSRLNHRYSMTYLESKDCGEVLTAFFKAKRLKKL